MVTKQEVQVLIYTDQDQDPEPKVGKVDPYETVAIQEASATNGTVQDVVEIAAIIDQNASRKQQRNLEAVRKVDIEAQIVEVEDLET